MQINANSWHYRLYVFNYQLIKAWNNNDYYYMEPPASRIGLCPYMRTILIWGPLVMLTYLITIGVFLSVFMVFPATATGIMGIVYLVSIILAIVAVFVGIGFITEMHYRRAEQKRDAIRKLKTNDSENSEKAATFRNVLTDFLKATKTKICPSIEVQHDNS